ncbi:MAG: isopentenyldiphosphate isomerase [Kiritimatiellia bacterium]|jgi:isopentenyldiphosphate isomerase
MSMDEWFDLVDEAGTRIGKALRAECHGNPELLHQAVHVMVYNARGELFLQQRGFHKDIQPGKWDSSVGGHLELGEEPEVGAKREMSEELGTSPALLEFVHQYLWRSPVESEFIRTYRTTHDGPFDLQASELEDGRFWSSAEIEAALGNGQFTPNFELEWEKLK